MTETGFDLALPNLNEPALDGCSSSGEDSDSRSLDARCGMRTRRVERLTSRAVVGPSPCHLAFTDGTMIPFGEPSNFPRTLSLLPNRIDESLMVRKIHIGNATKDRTKCYQRSQRRCQRTHRKILDY